MLSCENFFPQGACSQLRLDALSSCFSSPTIHKLPCCSLFSAMFSTFLCIVVDLSIESGPKCSADVLPSVPKGRKALMRLTEKMCTLDELCSGMRHSAGGHEFTSH